MRVRRGDVRFRGLTADGFLLGVVWVEGWTCAEAFTQPLTAARARMTMDFLKTTTKLNYLLFLAGARENCFRFGFVSALASLDAQR